MSSAEHQPVDLRLAVESSLEKVASEAYRRNLELGYLVDDDAPDAVLSDMKILQNVLVSLLEFCIRHIFAGFIQILVDTLLLYGNRYQLRITIKGVSQQNGGPKDIADVPTDAAATDTIDDLMTFCSHQASLIAGRMTIEEGQETGYCFHLNLQTESTPVALPTYRESFQPLLQYRQVLILSPHIINRELLLQQSKRWGLITRTFVDAKEIAADLLMPGAFDLAIVDSYWAHPGEPKNDFPAGVTLPEDLPIILCDCPGGRYPVAFQDIQAKAQLAKPIVPSRLYEALIHLLG